MFLAVEGVGWGGLGGVVWCCLSCRVIFLLHWILSLLVSSCLVSNEAERLTITKATYSTALRLFGGWRELGDSVRTVPFPGQRLLGDVFESDHLAHSNRSQTFLRVGQKYQSPSVPPPTRPPGRLVVSRRRCGIKKDFIKKDFIGLTTCTRIDG